MSFRDFYAEFDRLSSICGPYDDYALQDILKEKINRKLQEMLADRPGAGGFCGLRC